MSVFSLDKVTVLNVLAALLVLGYAIFMIVYPDKSVPEGLVALANMAIAYLFTTGGIAYALRLQQKNQ